MIDQGRIELNNRFKIVYKMLEDRGVIVKGNRIKSKSAFAEKLLGSKQNGHLISDFLNDERFISHKHAQILCNEFGVCRNYMFDGVGMPFSQPAQNIAACPQEGEKIDNDFITNEKEGNILFTTARAFAGWTGEVGSFQRENVQMRFRFPEMNGGTFFAFYVEGNSMEPIVGSGDMVICEPLEELDHIRDKEIYAVRHDGQLWIKHLQKIRDKMGNIRKILLTSANYLDHPPFEEIVNHTTQVFKVIKKICNI